MEGGACGKMGDRRGRRNTRHGRHSAAFREGAARTSLEEREDDDVDDYDYVDERGLMATCVADRLAGVWLDEVPRNHPSTSSSTWTSSSSSER
jgi:hypothetical protein